MKTRIFTLLFAVMAGMVTMNAEIYYGTCGANGDGSNILWTFNIETGALVLKGTGKMADYSDHTSVPWYEYRLFIESIELKSGITNIGVNAFYECKNLTSVILPEGLLSIGEAAFVMCVNLTEISLPNSLTTIERGAFNYCNSLTSMYIPANVSSIAPDAFLVSIVYDVSSRLPFIKTNFTHIDVDPANMYFASKDGVMYNKQMTKLIAYPAGKEGKFVVPNGVQEIGPFVFYGNMSLTEIEIPLSVTTIGEWAFGYCANLKSLTLPSSIKEIGAYAIGVVLPFITSEAVNPPTVLQSELNGSSLGFGNLYDEHNNPISQTLYVPANSVEAYKAAEGWKDIPNILPIPDTAPCLKASGTCGAEGDNLTWTLSCDSVLTISGTGAMYEYYWNTPWMEYKDEVRYVIVEEGVTTIGATAFRDFIHLRQCSLPSTLISIGEEAFCFCFQLMSVDIPQSCTTISGWGAFNLVPNVNIQDESIAKNCAARSINGYVEGYFVYADKSKRSLRACSSIAKGYVALDDAIERIEYMAFAQCEEITNLQFGSHLQYIGEWSLNGCIGLEGLRFQEGLKEIASNAFGNCFGLQYVYLPNSLTTLGDFAIGNCPVLRTIHLGDSLRNVGSQIFDYCQSIDTIYAPMITPPVLGDGAFAATTLSNVYLYVPCESIDAYKAADGWKEFTNIQAINPDDCPEEPSTLPKGALPGVFSVGENKTVYFSQGNLQYVGTWQFAENQWDYFGESQYDDHRDLFGWGTGDNPNEISKEDAIYATFIDWGANAIINGGNEANLWRTLTKDEWVYLFFGRENAATLFGLGSVNGVNGTILLPDNWVLPTGASFTASTAQGLADRGTSYYNSNGNNFSHNTFTAEQWSVMESAGAVFLPAAGGRYGTGMRGVGSGVSYCSATPYDTSYAYGLYFNSDRLIPPNLDNRSYGRSVRLVQDVQPAPCLLASGTCGKNLKWELSCDGVLTISGSGEMQHPFSATSWWPNSSLKSVVIEEGATNIASGAFLESSLTSITIPNSVTSLGDSVFMGCRSLTYIEIPNSVTSMGYQVFSGCSSLTSITCKAVTPPTLGFGVFDGVDKSIPLYVPGPSINLYKSADQWKDFFNILPIPGTEVPEYPVIFLDYNSDVLSEQSVAEGSAAIAPEVPEREGYIFKGWNVDIEHIIARTFAIALYDKVGVEVTYKAEDGETIFSEHADLHFPDAPSIEGKTFAGWLTENIDKNGIVLRATYTLDNPTTDDDVTVVPGSNSANVTFPFVTGAITYVLVIRDLFGNVVCKIMFSATGHLLGIAFAPSRNRESQQATQTTGFNFTVEGLDANTTYEYEFVANDDTDEVIETLSGSFTTTAEVPTDNEQVNSPAAVRKYLEDGHLMIDANSHIFNTQGKMIK